MKTLFMEKPFDEALEELADKNYRIISLQENARQRIDEGKDSSISINGNYVKDGILYIPKKNPILVKSSPILESPKEAMQAHRENKDFYPSKEQIEKALASRHYKLSQRKNFNIPTNKFGEDGLTVFAFEEDAEDYGLLLRGAGINEMSVQLADDSYVNNQKERFARQIFFLGLYG